MAHDVTDFVKEDVVAWLRNLATHGVRLELKNITELLDRIGNPQLSFRTVHVAGSDGKGSTSAMIASALRESGYRTGLYTSPHIIDLNERINVDGENISDDELLILAHEVMIVVECMNMEGFDCTFFEAVTALAFLYFRKRGVDFAVIEVGMGGRFDATNVLAPDVTVITNISREHTKYLGNTIREIAFEKAGIIKPGTPCVTCNTGDALEVISEVAAERGAPLVRIGEAEMVSMDEDGSFGTYMGTRYRIGIPGSYQISNAAMAIEALRRIPDADIPESAIAAGLEKVRWPARMEKVGGMPLIIDVTHTSAGMKVLKHDILALYGRVVTVFGILDDKDLCGMAASVSEMSDKVFVAAPATERALDPAELLRGTGIICDDVTPAASVEEAIDMAMAVRGDRMVLVTGSFRMAEAAVRWLRRTSA